MLYSGKHKFHCLKSEVGHVPGSGVAMRISTNLPGSRHDFDIYSANVGGWISNLKKTPEEKQRDGTNHDYWQQLADKGYQGANALPNVRMATPHKAMGRKKLTAAQVAENRRIATDRIVCENFYGRLKMLWAIMRNRWRFGRARYSRTFGNCVALVNHHILIGNPLRAEEQTWYRSHLQQLKSKAEAKKRKRDGQLEESRARRRRRLGLPPLESSSSSSPSSSPSRSPLAED